MSNLTSELNLSQAVDDDDTADYLTIALSNSLGVLDGLFNSATGHNHNGSHQGGALQFQNLSVGQDLTVNGQSILKGPVSAQSNMTVAGTLAVAGLSTLASLDVTGTSRLRGTVTIDGTINSGGTLTIGQDLSVGRDLSVARNATIVGSLLAGSISTGGGSLTVGANLSVGGAATITGLLTAARGVFGAYDGGYPLNVGGAGGITQGFWYQRGSASYRAWDNFDFVPAVAANANSVVQRDASGYIVQASYMNYTGDLQPGTTRPVEVLGRQAGDHLLRWWPANAIGPPAVARYLMGALTLPALSPSGATANATVAATSNSLGATIVGGVITVPYAGWYSIAGGFQGNNLTGNTETMQVSLISSAKGTIDSANASLKISSYFGGYFSYEGLLAAGETIRLSFTTQFDSINGSGEILISFVPIADYPN